MRDDLDTLPMPARHLIKHYAPHYYINFRKPLALLETTPANPRSGERKASAGGKSMGGGSGPIGGGGPICIFAVKVSSTRQMVWLSSRKQVTGSLL